MIFFYDSMKKAGSLLLTTATVRASQVAGGDTSAVCYFMLNEGYCMNKADFVTSVLCAHCSSAGS